MTELGRLFLMLGGALLLIGGVLLLGSKIPWFGHLPGDIVIEKKNVQFYFPLATCLLVSLLFSLLFSLFGRK